MSDKPAYAWVDGEIVPWADAKIHIASDALLRGANVFEGERAYWSDADNELYMFRHREHLDRLKQSARFMRMSIPYSDDELNAACIALLRKNGWRDSVHFRPVVYFGEGEGQGHMYKPEDIRTGVFIIGYCRPSKPTLFSGIRSCVSTWRRNPDVAAPSRVKSAANYHNARLAQVEASMNGFGTPLMLNMAGKVAESPGSCFMMIRKGVVYTPPVTADILESITRETLIQLLRDEMGLTVVERDIDRSETYMADEAFFCGSGQEVQPINSIDHYDLGDGKPGPVTRALQTLYFDVAKGKHAKYRHWLTPVYGNARAAAAD